MATEVTSLISDEANRKTVSLCELLKRRYQMHVYPRGAYIVLLYWGLVFCMLFNTITYSPVVREVIDVQHQLSHLHYVGLLILLLYPFLGLIGEKFNRFKMINIGVIIIILGQFFRGLFKIDMFSSKLLSIMNLFALCSENVGIGLFTTNCIQFALDQLLFESSDKLKSYVYWLFTMIYLPVILIYLFLILLTMFVDYTTLYWSIVAIPWVLWLLILMFLFVMCYCKRHIHIEPPPRVNPVKHIYKVMKYAWFNKYPVRRSAYTYTERPSRLDLCKDRYGGPFTTEEVEDVKSFWRILLVLISMFGIYCLDNTAGIGNDYYNRRNITYSNKVPIPVMYPEFLSIGSILLSIFTMQLFCVPFVSRYLPRLLTRMGIGLFLSLCTSCSLTLLSMWLDEETSFISYLLVIPQVMYGCSQFLALFTTLEFIVAQSPLRMQGLLIGIWVCQYYFYYGFTIVSLSMTNHLWQYYTAKTVLIFISCLSFLITSSRYKYRERNETTDVNERLIIAEYHERQILARDEDLDDIQEYDYD